jgi:hypothetical protein
MTFRSTSAWTSISVAMVQPTFFSKTLSMTMPRAGPMEQRRFVGMSGC